MSRSWSRLRLFLVDSFASVLVVLVVLALLGGWLTYTTHVAPGTHVEERVVATWQTTGSFEHGATVTNGSAAFPAGTRLSNQSVYFSSVAPVLDGTFAYTYSASEGSLAANTTLTFVLHAVEEDDSNITEYWRVTRPLGSTETDSLAPGETQRVEFSADLNATERRIERIQETLGDPPGTVEALVVARTTFDGTIENASVSRTKRYALQIALEDGQYTVTDAEAVTNQSEVTRQVSVPNDYGPLREVGSVLLLLVPLGLLAVLVGANQQGWLGPDDTTREHLTLAATREEFDEWITTARLPNAVLDAPHVEVNSLAGLVDLAIDTNRRVIEDPEWEGYVVLAEGVCYTYTPSHPLEGFEFDEH